MQFNIPTPPRKYTKVLSNFLGVDFTSIIPNIRRSPNMINMVNNNGYLETRPGYNSIGHTFVEENVGLPINGIWNIDKDNVDMFVVHVKNKLYLLDSNFDNPVEIPLSDTMNNQLSQGVYINNKLFIFDGKRAIVYGKFGDNWVANYLDTVGYVPTTVISRNPDGTGGTTYEDINLVQSYRINSFLSDGVSATYVLDSVYDDEEPTCTILQSDGTIANLTVQSYDKDNKTVTFTEVPPKSPVDGRDNVFIRFSVTNTENKSYINKSTIITTYGYDGNNNRIFVTGNSDFPNVDWFSAPEDGTYFPAENYTRVGFQPIKNYLKLNDGSLAIQKELSDTDATTYYRKSAIFNGKEVFPISAGVKTIGCISKYANANLLNDPLTLSETGVYGIIGSSYNEKFAVERSYFIKNKLLQESNLENAIAIVFQNKYYLAINNHVYVADSRYKSKVEESTSSGFQYEWYYWENVPVRIWLVYNNELYFCTDNGKIVKFNNTCLDYDTPISVYFTTSFLDLDSLTQAKTIKKINVITRPFIDNEYVLGCVTSDDMYDISKREFSSSDFPKTGDEKERIRKFMFVQLYLKNNTKVKMSFYQIALEYVFAGKYRGD